MTDAEDSLARARQLVGRSIDEYVQKRLTYYRSRRPPLLPDLLKKDAMLWVLRGARTSADWADFALSAHESSSEETMMGNAWQQILQDLSVSAVGAGDMLLERDDVLWVVEVKSQTNTLNSASRAQTLKTLRRKVLEHSRIRTPRRRAVMAMVGIIRGDPYDRQKPFVATSPEDAEIDGFPYREMVGAPFRAWLTGLANPAELVQQDTERAAGLASARAACLAGLKREIAEMLRGLGLADDMSSILQVTSGEGKPRVADR